MIKEKKSLKGKIPSRRKFFKAAAATGAAATAHCIRSSTNSENASCLAKWC